MIGMIDATIKIVNAMISIVETTNRIVNATIKFDEVIMLNPEP